MKKAGEGSDQTYGDPSVRVTGRRATDQRATYGYGFGLARGAFLLGICFVLLIGCGAAGGAGSLSQQEKERLPVLITQ